MSVAVFARTIRAKQEVSPIRAHKSTRKWTRWDAEIATPATALLVYVYVVDSLVVWTEEEVDVVAFSFGLLILYPVRSILPRVPSVRWRRGAVYIDLEFVSTLNLVSSLHAVANTYLVR